MTKKTNFCLHNTNTKIFRIEPLWHGQNELQTCTGLTEDENKLIHDL